MSIVRYLKLSGLFPATESQQQALQQAVAHYLQQYQQQLEQVQASGAAPAMQWQYQVPELGEGGACSLFGQLAEQPYDLTAILGGQTAANQQLLQQMASVTDFYQSHSKSDWFGIYQRRVNLQGDTVLVKLSYFGAPSRAEFPLTAEFAAISNNSTVGLTGKARIINDVPAYLQQGGEYYTCDPKVLAEACIPLYDEAGQVVGIIDSEAFQKQLFEADELALLIATAILVPTLWAAQSSAEGTLENTDLNSIDS
ncbi:histidine kinase [Rheinheimera riviphila]|uniref:Histidine kinase n=1 Tax=Rheinheimera riviphila TaxID=1834037 RepID=A0A437QIQ5_9GAMM|nr:histidine kinase [Rheinheimera riviphila]RVU34316.1 histidine kinase [Rheinheimera riviphila]